MEKIKKILLQLFSTFAIISTFQSIVCILNFFEILNFLGMFESFFLLIIFILILYVFYEITIFLTQDKDIKIKKQEVTIKTLWNLLSEEQRKEYNLKIKKENYELYQKQLENFHNSIEKTKKEK